jgi:hypothetical protein
MDSKIRTLVFLGFTAAAASLSGCIIDGSSSPPPDSCAASRYIVFDWTMTEQATGLPLGCADVPARSVRLYVGATPYDFACSAQQGLTTSIPSGTYTLDAQLIGPDGLIKSDTGPASWTVPRCDFLDLGTIDFIVR